MFLLLPAICGAGEKIDLWEYETSKITFSFSTPEKFYGELTYDSSREGEPKILVDHSGPNDNLVGISEYWVWKDSKKETDDEVVRLPICVNVIELLADLEREYKLDVKGFRWNIPIDGGDFDMKSGYTLMEGVKGKKHIKIKIVWRDKVKMKTSL
ncbi:hypothetical protein SAMN02745181_0265 [Rubritalea squalenifaciens DSM 18772]|uniref:Uncharacterized protein n=2 Tax=Rubritalea squalenifaciens TaxID=407226 RepID=A0A1M6BMP3_9BACT|nr:hypothetical protein SAMN02745181_0265 [Rubritalea squalenifaciens DSM 18772]